MQKANLDVRETAKRCHVTQWQIAEKMGCSEHTVHRRLRTELPEEEKVRFIGIISEIAREQV